MTSSSGCLLCGSHLFESLIPKIKSVYSRVLSWSIDECQECGLLQTIPCPTKKQLDQIYGSTYAYNSHKLVSLEKARRARGLIKATNMDMRGREVLDIGCGSGILLQELQFRGARVFGCEVSPIAAREANERLGHDVVTCAGVEDYLANRSQLPEICILSHSLEHFRNPLGVLRRINNLLPPNGKLLVVVPNADKSPRGLMRKYWGYWQVPVHIVHFTEKTLKKMLVSAGFVEQLTAFRSADFLSIGLTFSNIFGLDVKRVNRTGAIASAAVRLVSVFWSYTYKFGRQDLIVVSTKIKVARHGNSSQK